MEIDYNIKAWLEGLLEHQKRADEANLNGKPHSEEVNLLMGYIDSARSVLKFIK